jgi:hypothetical protein
MRRLLVLVPTIAALLGLAVVGTADAATSKTYTVTRTVGPYSGTAKDGEKGFPHSNGEADTVSCRRGDKAIKGSAKINRRTSHGTARGNVVQLGRRGVTYNSESGFDVFYVFVDPNGRKGWNSVTLTVACRRR